TGEWATPIELDPFTVPLRDQTALLSAYQAAAMRVWHGSSGLWGTMFHWRRETRVFASTEGALTTQTLYRSEPIVRGAGDCGMGNVELQLPHVRAASGGYETVAIP